VVGLTTHSTDGDTAITVGVSGNTLTATSLRSQLTQQQYPIVSVALGLQHAIALDSMGHVYTFGKGERGQLGNGHATSLPYAVHIPIHRNLISKQEEVEEEENDKSSSESERSFQRLERARARYLKKLSRNSAHDTPVSSPWLPVTHVAAGFNHCACITETNHVFIWGKHTIFDKKNNKYEDSHSPIMVPGLPLDTKVVDLSCGSRHTSILLEDGSIWATGIASDNGTPLLDNVVKIMDAPRDGSSVKFFKSCFDNTIVITEETKRDSDGQRKQKVRYINLWSTEELRMDQHVDSLRKEEPEWVNQIDSEHYITKVDVGWLHTVVVTKTGRSI
jgi:alpha-tubulin suppressor-like RCC1 family protein